MGVGALEGALHHSECIKRGSKNTETRDHRDWDADFIRAQQDENLSNEIAHPRQTERGQTEEERSSAQARRHGPKTAHFPQVASVDTFLQTAYQDEKSTRAQPVANHRHDRALERKRVPGEDSEQHKSQVTHAGVSDQAFDIGLGESHHGAVNDPDHSQHQSYRSEL